ncbi:hypothetical protein LTR28_013980, partial [Elasticomyces elasticus]
PSQQPATKLHATTASAVKTAQHHVRPSRSASVEEARLLIIPPELDDDAAPDPVPARRLSCCLLVANISVLLSPGQNTTAKPAPAGMMKVDVWSSYAKLYASGQTDLAAVE